MRMKCQIRTIAISSSTTNAMVDYYRPLASVVTTLDANLERGAYSAAGL